MQFSLKRLFAAVFASALLTIILKNAIDRRPQVSGPTLLVLAAPAIMGLIVVGLSTALMLRHMRRLDEGGPPAVSKYKNLAGIGMFAGLPLIVYIFYCCLVATPPN